MLVGDNQYYSEALQKKVDAMKRICIGNLPKILIIHLKRFQYNYETFQRYKINKEFHFPMQVKMGKYTKEGLEKSDQMKKLESEQNENEDEPNKQNESNESMPIPKEVEQISSENDGEEYELVGIIVHNGSTESGHYYSLIKEPKTSKWIRFDDIRVLEFDMSDLAEECFGKGGIIVPNANDYYDSNEKRNSAYLLIYRKITQYPQNDLDSPQKSTQITQESIPQKFYQEIIQENLQFRAKKYLFNNDYFDFCFSILELGQQTYSNSLTSLTTNLTQFAMKFLINLIAHFKKQRKFKYSKVKDQDQDQEEEEEDWYSKCILKMGPINEFRLQIYSIIIEALKILATEEKTKISSFNLEEKKRNEAHLETLQENEVYEYWMSMQMMRQIKDEPKKQTEVSLVIEFASQLLQTLPEAKFHFSALSDYFGFLYDLLSVGEAVIEYFASTNLIAKMIDFYLDEKSPLRKTANNKQNQSQVVEDSYFQQQFVKMLSIIEEIVLKTENKINKSQEIDEKKSLVLSKIDYRMITEEKFIEKMISLEINPESLKKILNHISFENIEFTQHIIELLSREMKSKTYLEIGRYFTFYNSLLEINDSLSQQRLDLVLSKLKDSISQKFSFENSTSVSLNYLGELCKSNAAAMEWFLGNKDKWMIEWLVQNRYLAARNSVLQFIAIFFNYKESEKDQINTKILLEFEDYFINILPKIKEECYQGVEKEKEEMKNLNKSKISDDFFQMTSYFDFFRMYCLEQKEAAEKLFANFDMFWECMEYIDKVMLNYDLNKKHLLMLFEACFRIYPDQLNQQLINNKERTEKYLQLFDSFQEHNAYITEYLQSTLKLYFQILQQCLNQNEEFANLLKSSKLFKVSIMEILFKSQDFYSEIGDIILKTFGMFALKQKDYRLEQINMISSNVYEFLNNSPITTIKFLDQMIIDKEDAWMFYKTENNFYYLQLIITVFASQMHQQNSNFRSLRDIIMHIYQIRNSRFDNKGANQAILHGLSLVDKMTKLLGTDIRNIEDFVINQKMLSVLYQVVPFIGGIDEEVSNKYFEVSSTLILSNPMLVINFINQIISFHHANIESHRLEELRSEHTGTKSNLDDKVFFSINEYHHFLESIVFAGLKLNQKQVDDFQKRIEEMETESRKKYQSENENQNENENENQNENQNQNQNENQNENSQNEIESIRLRAIKLLFFILVDISRYELFNSRFLKFSNKLISLYPDDFKEAFGQYQDYLVLYFEKTIEKCIVVFNNEWIFFQEFIKFLNSKNDQNSNQILSNLLSKIFLGIENRKNDSSITRLEELKVLLISAKIILFETKNSQEMIKLFVGNVFGSDSLGWIFEQFQNNQEIIDLASFLISYF
ncbi:ubiquitin carboxyl-terminal hydrolase [Anaeramoeba ignava]|uniref:Ubiquitin carboxyl-terminal hydrolase n=1 Tax=Anaeramoeba ignava TaxID=1746090 RepID=A0A9Q0LTP3_ANAIG|nr:ubiquitin carboxyl-terminal hydrolase [Anaeramoeba ignava]